MPRTSLLLAALSIILLAPPTAMSQRAVADLRTASGESITSVSLTQASHEVLIAIGFRNRMALVGSHAVELHTADRCDPPDFTSSGPVLMSLPHLVIGPAGVGVYNISATGTTLSALPGKSLVVVDDAGVRAACAVIGGGPPSVDRPDPTTSVAIALMGGLLLAGGVLLRRGA